MTYFNWHVYKELNPDLLSLGLDNEYKLKKHWKTHGYRQQRKCRVKDIDPSFDPDKYREQNHEIKNKLKTTLDCELHWIKHVYKSNENVKNNTSVDLIIEDHWEVYKELNPEMKKDKMSVEQCLQYIRQNNNRLITFQDVYPDFNIDIYMELNPDISKQFNTDREMRKHYAVFGRKEGRIYKPDQKKSPSFHILIATGGRKSIINMLRSLLPQLIEKDYLTIVFDGPKTITHLNLVNNFLKKFKCKISVIVEPKNLGFWGHGIRNKHNKLEGDFVLHADDDDFYLPNAFEQLRKLCRDRTKIYITNVQLKTGKLLNTNNVEINNISTQSGVIPAKYNSQSIWRHQYGGDYYFYENLARIYNKHLIFLGICVYTMNILSPDIFDANIYRLLNPDLKDCCYSNEDYKNHWVFCGFNECRLTKITDIIPDFDWMKHSDKIKKKSAVEIDWINKHEINQLIEQESIDYKDSFKSFNLEIYKELNPDLQRAGLRHINQILDHWIKHGQFEKRKVYITDLTPDFDWMIYKKLNPDLKLKSRLDYELHWINTGSKENRRYKLDTNSITPKENITHKSDVNSINSKEDIKYKSETTTTEPSTTITQEIGTMKPIERSNIQMAVERLNIEKLLEGPNIVKPLSQFNGSHAVKPNKIEIVMARYNEIINYIDKKPFDKYPAIIYNKGPNLPQINEKNKITQLSNVGRCDHTYLYHIINNYDNLAEVTIFLPGSCLDGNKRKYTNNVLEFVKKNHRTCLHGKQVKDVLKDNYNFQLNNWKCSNPQNRSINPESTLALCPERPFGKWYEKNFGKISINIICYCGIFAVSKNHIRQHPKEHYEKLIKYVENHSNPEAGHYIERSWGAIFYPIPTNCIYYGI